MFSLASKASATRESSDLSALLRCGASMVAICAFAAASPAIAQTGSQAGAGTAGQAQSAQGASGGAEATVSGNTGVAAADTTADDQAIVVTGIRQSLANSQNLKRN